MEGLYILVIIVVIKLKNKVELETRVLVYHNSIWPCTILNRERALVMMVFNATNVNIKKIKNHDIFHLKCSYKL